MQSAINFRTASEKWASVIVTCVRAACFAVGFLTSVPHALSQKAGNLALNATPTNAIEGYEASFPALGTIVEIKVFSDNAELVSRIVRAAEQRTADIESTLTDYSSDSEASMLTEKAVGEAFLKVSDDLWNMLAASQHWYQVSDGAFDASLGNLTRQWRAARRKKTLLTDEQRQKALQQVGWQHIELNPAAKSVRFKREGVRLDFGAIGKGYVADEIFKLFETAGLKQCLVNISGNMRLGDPPPDREGWRIEIAPLEAGQPILRRLILANTAIATSGDLWQFAVIDGQRHSHILDPRTGKSVRGPIAATVIAPSAADADACATAVCVLGPAAGAQLVLSLPQFEVLILEHSDADSPVRYIVTEGLAKQHLERR